MTGPSNQGDAMTDIQEQLKQHLEDFRQPSETDDGAFSSSTRSLLRAFLEKCCAAECKWCKEGLPVSKRKGRWMHDPGEPAFYRNCDADNIRRTFAWLEEK